MDEPSYYSDDDLYFTSDSDDFEDWNLETAMAAWETGSQEREAEGHKPASHGGAVEMGTVKKKGKKSKTEFVMTEELAEQIHYSERVSLSDFIGQMNDLRDGEAMKRLTIKSVEQWLMDKGCFEVWFLNGTPRKRLTDKGEEFGIMAEKRLSEKGNEYDVFFYSEEAQRSIVEWLSRSGWDRE